MDALVDAALEKTTKAVAYANREFASPKVRKDTIVRAINAVDALKSALKAL